MSHCTHSGRKFSLFEGFLPVDPANIDRSYFQIHQMDVSLEELFAAAEEAAELHAQAFKDAVMEPKTKAKKPAPKPWRLRTTNELVNEMGYKYLSWDGKKPLLILDHYGRIIVGFAGALEDPEWPSVVRKASEAMKEVWDEGFCCGTFGLADESHRRGNTFCYIHARITRMKVRVRPNNSVPRFTSEFSEYCGSQHIHALILRTCF
ncbi:hypothetical protein C8F04DRAFT_1186612 [Mycena alexandri]|uniref:Uncharacterized protein n=1 Tax=Mycena alexandri TaxID=1745969 RepID=A0AAD6SN05_9AGAR|nr:hypothetical protein C8F04DRAFT_1186612 [Mycena alexandri]